MSDYDHCEWSLQKIIQVSTLNLFDFMPENHNDSFEILPSHLWAQHPSVYFYGLLKLLLSMDQEVISLKLMRASEHKQIPDTLINTMEGDYGKGTKLGGSFALQKDNSQNSNSHPFLSFSFLSSFHLSFVFLPCILLFIIAWFQVFSHLVSFNIPQMFY